MIELSKLLVYFHFRSVKLHYAYVEETHMMLVAFFAFVKFVAAVAASSIIVHERALRCTKTGRHLAP